MLNTITIMGRLTRDPELKQGVSSNFCNFCVAVERDFKNKQTGEKETDFLECVAFTHTADFVSKYMTKGRMAIVNGRIQVEKWVDKEGKNRNTTKIVATSVYFGDSAKDAQAPQKNQQQTNYGQPSQYQNQQQTNYGQPQYNQNQQQTNYGQPQYNQNQQESLYIVDESNLPF